LKYNKGEIKMTLGLKKKGNKKKHGKKKGRWREVRIGGG
jgi:hypothetical protein